jgi:hypothetical protein
MLDNYFRDKGIREQVELEYFTREAEPTGEAHDPVVWMDAESKRRGIKQNYEFVARSIDTEKKVVRGLYNYQIDYDLLVMCRPSAGRCCWIADLPIPRPAFASITTP